MFNKPSKLEIWFVVAFVIAAAITLLWASTHPEPRPDITRPNVKVHKTAPVNLSSRATFPDRGSNRPLIPVVAKKLAAVVVTDVMLNDMSERINRYLADSPMAGLGPEIVRASEANGIDPRLIPAIARIESGAGRQLAGRYNPFGRKANYGWMAFNSFSEAVNNEAVYVRKMWGPVTSPTQMTGYCVPPHPWMENVAAEMNKI